MLIVLLALERCLCKSLTHYRRKLRPRMRVNGEATHQVREELVLDSGPNPANLTVHATWPRLTSGQIWAHLGKPLWVPLLELQGPRPLPAKSSWPTLCTAAPAFSHPSGPSGAPFEPDFCVPRPWQPSGLVSASGTCCSSWRIALGLLEPALPLIRGELVSPGTSIRFLVHPLTSSCLQGHEGLVSGWENARL